TGSSSAASWMIESTRPTLTMRSVFRALSGRPSRQVVPSQPDLHRVVRIKRHRQGLDRAPIGAGRRAFIADGHRAEVFIAIGSDYATVINLYLSERLPAGRLRPRWTVQPFFEVLAAERIRHTVNLREFFAVARRPLDDGRARPIRRDRNHSGPVDGLLGHVPIRLFVLVVVEPQVDPVRDTPGR